jgi:hypothetical protein
MKPNYGIDFASKEWKLAEINDQSSDAHRWHVAHVAHGMVGKRNGGTRKLAENIMVYDRRTRKWHPASDDLVENLARAYAMFLILYSIDKQKAKAKRREYSYTRFVALHHVFSKYEPDPSQLFDLLDLDGGTRAMMAFAENAYNPLDEWVRHGKLAASLLEKIINDYGAPASWKEKATLLRNEIMVDFEVRELLAPFQRAK